MARATWKGAVIAESSATQLVEGNVYFPREAVHEEFLKESAHRSTCSWKGQAHYFDVVVNGETLKDAVWSYPAPSEAAKNIRGYLAFWKGVQVEA